MDWDVTGFVGRARHLAEVARVLGDVTTGAWPPARGDRRGRAARRGSARRPPSGARMQGVQLAWASRWESASVAALWPWRQLLRQLVADRPALVEGLGARARWIDVVMGRAAAAGDDPDTARVEVADAVLDLLRAAGRDCPGLLVVDDLQWADAPSLRLLAGVAPALRSMPVAMAVTCRDGEVTGSPPRSAS